MREYIKNSTLLLCLSSIWFVLFAQNIDLKGKIVNYKGDAISGATVSLRRKKIKVRTNKKGEFSISATDNKLQSNKNIAIAKKPQLRGGILSFHINVSVKVSVDLYTMQGRYIHTIFHETMKKGFYSTSLLTENFHSKQPYVVYLKIGDKAYTFKVSFVKSLYYPKFTSLKRNNSTMSRDYNDNNFTKNVDTLKIVGKMSKKKYIPIKSYIGNYPSIKLKRVNCMRCHIGN